MIQTTSHDPGVVVVRPGVERLTAINAHTFRDEVIDVIERGDAQLVVDFEGVSFMDSSGLGALVRVLKKVGVRGDLAVCGLSDDVSQMFKICRMDRVFTICDNVESAVEKIGERV